MNKLLLLLILSFPAFGQYNRQITYYQTDPSGMCTPTVNMWLNWPEGKLWQCQGPSTTVNSGTWTLLSSSSPAVSSVSWASVPSWLTATVATATTTPALTLAPTTGQTSHRFIGTCNAATTFAPCAIVPGDVPTLNQDTSGNAATASAFSSNPANCASNQFAQSIAADGDLTCAALAIVGAQFTNQGTTSTLLHGNAAGQFSFAKVASADLAITASTCTNQFITVISAAVAGTCTTAVLASAQFANQGSTTTILHGNAGGNPSWGQVLNADITNATIDVTTKITGRVPTTNLSANSLIRSCIVIIGDPDAGSPMLADGNDRPVACDNQYGQDLTITSVACWANAGTPSITPILTGGGATSILTGALSCGAATWAAGTLNGTPVMHSFSGGGATCSVTPCSADVNITTAGGTARYVVVKIFGTI